MKPLILVTLLLGTVACFGQASKTTTIRLSTGDCRKDEVYSWNGADTVDIYRLPADTLAYKIIPRNHNQWPIEIRDIPVGNYRLAYKNMYGQQVTEEITLAEQATNAIGICPDKLSAYPQNTLAKLQEKDTISITYHSQGCFHSTRKKLTITKENDRYVARLFADVPYYPRIKGRTAIRYRENELIKTVILDEQQARDFTRFENELNYAGDMGCTTVDKYIFRSKYLDIEREDGSCEWNGFMYLEKSLFGDLK